MTKGKGKGKKKGRTDDNGDGEKDLDGGDIGDEEFERLQAKLFGAGKGGKGDKGGPSPSKKVKK